MRLVHIDELDDDMVLAKPIIDRHRYLLCKGQDNLTRFKDKLEELGISYIYIEDDISEDIEINEAVREETRQNAQATLKNFSENLEENNQMFSETFSETPEVVKDIIEEILNRDDIIVSLYDMKTINNYLFTHSVNVTVLSIIIARNLDFIEFDRKKIENLAIGALLHDLGKLGIPEEILNKPEDLNEEEWSVIKQHPQIGYEKFREYDYMIPTTSLRAVKSHHENYDGSGYPAGLKGEDIHIFPRIVSVADCLDALTSDRPYRERWSVTQAAQWMIAQSNQKFDPRIIKGFMQYIVLYPNGTEVLLSNNKRAIVYAQNKNFPRRPVVKLIETGNLIDLQKRLDITIKTDKISEKLPEEKDTGKTQQKYDNTVDNGLADKKVLITDDQLFMRHSLEQILTDMGFEEDNIIHAEDGRVAIEKHEEEKPDLITLDITMPEVNGIEAAEKISEKNNGTAILMVSAMGQKDMVMKSLDAGAKDFIVKPFEEQKIKKKITKIL